MHHYTVLAISRSRSGYALRLADEAGICHVARATATVPSVGAQVLGSAPALGFGLLLGATTDQVFRVSFEQVHCSEDDANRSLYGTGQRLGG
jgi:hypothetical protein